MTKILIHTVAGLVDLLTYDAPDVSLDAIIVGLSQARWSAQTAVPITVLQHSVDVASLLAEQGESLEVILEGLLHDGAESLVGDVIRPIKDLMPGYAGLEMRVDAAVMQRFGIMMRHHQVVKRADLEIRDMETSPGYRAWGFLRARDEFRDYFWALMVLRQLDASRWALDAAEIRSGLAWADARLVPEYVEALVERMVEAGAIWRIEGGMLRRRLSRAQRTPAGLRISPWRDFEVEVGELEGRGRSDAWLAGYVRGRAGHDWACPDMLGLRAGSEIGRLRAGGGVATMERAWHAGYRVGADVRTHGVAVVLGGDEVGLRLGVDDASGKD